MSLYPSHHLDAIITVRLFMCFSLYGNENIFNVDGPASIANNGISD
jgi:hypothetical protein